jgi:predicted peptidase
MRRVALTLVVAVGLIAGSGCASLGGPFGGAETGMLSKTMTTDGGERTYMVYVPEEYDPEQRWPLVVFLHGAGERGDDGVDQSTVGIGPAIEENPERFPCIVVMPQCPTGVMWPAQAEHIDTVISLTLAEYSIDESRMYLTGLSMGGYGTFMYGADNVDRFAALVPICGGGRITDAAKLATVPMWVFHGEADPVVTPDKSRSMVEAIKAAGGDIRYTEYPEVGHNSWDAAYGDPELMAWMLGQRK